MMSSLCPVNEIKLLAFLSVFAIASLTGLVTGLTLNWQHNWVSKLTGLAIGSGVGVLAMMVLNNMVDTMSAVPVPGEANRYTFTCGPDLFGNVTLGWTMLYAVKVTAITLTTKFATTSLFSLGSMAMRSATWFERVLRQRNARRE